jgi:hypothetical protein
MAYLSKDEYWGLFEYRNGELFWLHSPRVGKKVRGKLAGWHNSSNGYTCVTVFRRKSVMQRIVWIMHNGDIPSKMQIDHINRNKEDNRIENLRLCTQSQNSANRPSQTKNTLYKGVSKYQQKRKLRYTAHICVDNKQKNLGYFDTPEAAALAYNRAAIERFGEFAFVNEVPGG